VIRDPYDYIEVGAMAPEPETDCDVHEPPCSGCRPLWDDEPDEPQGGEHYIEVEMREEREDG